MGFYLSGGLLAPVVADVDEGPDGARDNRNRFQAKREQREKNMVLYLKANARPRLSQMCHARSTGRVRKV